MAREELSTNDTSEDDDSEAALTRRRKIEHIEICLEPTFLA